ncbi:MAG: cache domain-containing protein, partial [Halomonas sp.]|nr:cache domain-containing protein [Halomonas sp.]
MKRWRFAEHGYVSRLLTLGVRSLHKRLLLGLAMGWIVVVAALLVSTWSSGQLLIREVSDEHLEYEARILAEEIEQEVQLRFEVLKRLAEQLGAPQALEPGELQTELRHNDALLALFDGLVAIGEDGRVLADWPQVAGREGLNVTDTEYFRFQRQVGAPYVSEPFFGRASLTPLVMFSVPIHDPAGNFAGMIGGVIAVEHGSFFEKLRRIRIGERGFAAVMTASGQVLVHPEREWILRPTPPTSQNPWLDLALAGWEGTALGPLVSGDMALQAYQQVWSANWVVAVFVPQMQAFGPLQWFVRHLWLVGTVTVVVML